MTAPMNDTLHRMFAHAAWANDLLLDELRAKPVSDPEVQLLLNHVIGAEHLWLSRIAGRPPRVAVWPSFSAAECAALAAENVAAFQELLALDEAALERVVHYRNSAGREFDNTVRDILIHVALHGHYHRGQIATRMRAAGRTPVYTDYIGWARREQ